MYHNAVRGGVSHGHGQHAQKFSGSAARFSSYMSGQTDRQTDKQTYSFQYFTMLMGRSNNDHDK